MSDSYLPKDNSNDDWEREVDAATTARQNKIQRLRIAESGSGEYDDEKKPLGFWKRLLRFFGWMLLIVLLTGGGAFAGWYFWLRHEAPVKTSTAESSPPPAPPASVEPETENYSSTPFMLQFDFPKGWTVAETGDNRLVVTSAPLQLKVVGSGSAASGKVKQQTGQVQMIVQHKQTTLPAFAEGEATAIIESERIEYARPSQDQRAATYVTFLSYASSGGKGIDAVYISGDNGYVKDQLVSQSDIVKADPLISLSFRSCNDSKCTATGQPVTVSADAWKDASFGNPLKNMLRSIVVQ